MSERNLWAEPDDAYDRKPLPAESGEVVPPLMPVSDVPEITAAVDGSEWPDFVAPFVQEGNAAEPDPMHSPDSDSDFLGAEGPSAPTETTGSANQPPDNTDPPSGGRGIEGVGEGGDESGSARGIDQLFDVLAAGPPTRAEQEVVRKGYDAVMWLGDYNITPRVAREFEGDGTQPYH